MEVTCNENKVTKVFKINASILESLQSQSVTEASIHKRIQYLKHSFVIPRALIRFYVDSFNQKFKTLNN